MRIYVEIANTPDKRENGLMYRKKLPHNAGMLFDFKKKCQGSFWMKNTYIPLDIAFIDDKGTILQIENMYPLSLRSVAARQPYKYALEVNKNWFNSHKITVGQNVALSAGLPNQNPAVELIPISSPNPDTIKPILEQAETGQKFYMLYWDDDANMVLPPRVISPIGNGFKFKKGKDGELVEVYDESPGIDGQGWENKGPGIKTFKVNNIISLEVAK